MRRATIALAFLVGLLGLVGCSDLRDFRGVWSGRQVGEARALSTGVTPDGAATLTIQEVDAHGLKARLTVDGLVDDAAIEPLKGAEADVLAGITFSGAPLRVYLAFAPVRPSGDAPGSDALVVVALYDDHRVEVRLLRGRPELYGIYLLTEAAAAP